MHVSTQPDVRWFFRRKQIPFIKGRGREYERKQWLLEGFSRCKL